MFEHPDSSTGILYDPPRKDDPMADEEHSLVVAFGVKCFGNEENIRRTVEEMKRWLSVEMHRDVEVVAFGYTKRGSVVTNSLAMDELVEDYEKGSTSNSSG